MTTMSVRENAAIGALPALATGGVVGRDRERTAVRGEVAKLSVKTASMSSPAGPVTVQVLLPALQATLPAKPEIRKAQQISRGRRPHLTRPRPPPPIRTKS